MSSINLISNLIGVVAVSVLFATVLHEFPHTVCPNEDGGGLKAHFGGEKFRLHYFNARGKAEPIRLFLTYINAEFTEVRYSSEMWAQAKAKNMFEFDQVPALEVIDYPERKKPMHAQTGSILRSLAAATGLRGKNIAERRRAEEISGLADDLKRRYSAHAYGKSKEESLQDFKTKTAPLWLNKFETALYANGGAYGKGTSFVNDDLTFADFECYAAADAARALLGHEAFASERPQLAAFMRRVETLPQIKEYMEWKRPASINGKTAVFGN